MVSREMAGLASVAVAYLCLFSLIIQSEGASALQDPITFAPPHSNYASDIDGDSLFEYLTVQVGVNVSEPGWYFVVGTLYASVFLCGVWDADFSPYEVGVYTSVLEYSASDIVTNGLNGTFYVELELYTQDSVKIATSEYTLGNYSILDFDDSPPTTFEGPHTDQGLDTDGDDVFNYLAIGARINVTSPGSYGVKATIEGLTTNDTGDARNSTFLEIGIQVVELRFNGDLFANAEMDGPYSVYLELMDSEFNRFYTHDSFVTQAYDWTQFLNAGASFSSPHSDESLDINDDGAMEYLAVYVHLNVTTPGYYNVTGTLSITYDMDTQWRRSELEAGYWNVTLLFPGDVIKATMYNGSFTVRLDLYDGSNTWLWNYIHRTADYRWIDFALPPVASLETVVIPDGTNFNLTLDASVSTVETIEYEVRWDFNGDGTWDTDWSTNKTVIHQFPGPGTYTVILEVRDLRGLTSQSTVQVTVNPPAVIDYPGDDDFMLVTIFLVGGLIIGVAALAYAWPVEVLVAAALALLMPLYSRLRDSDPLDNYRRGMIHGLILAHPGICLTDIKEALSISNGALVYHLGVLQRSGDVICRRSGALTRYYINGAPLSQVAKFGLTDLQIQIVRLVISRGHTTKMDIQQEVGASRQVVHYNLKKLVADNILASSFVSGHRLFRMAMGDDRALVEAFSKELPVDSDLRRTMDAALEETPD